jgi:hypothetical protein
VSVLSLFNVLYNFVDAGICVHSIDWDFRMIIPEHPENLVCKWLPDFCNPFEVKYDFRKICEPTQDSLACDLETICSPG